MDVRTGKIYESRQDASPDAQEHLKEMVIKPTTVQRNKMRVGRNDKCPCGSGKKFKKCCYSGGNPTSPTNKE
jgi:uncharacterized protein YecA (UPF0149 family)